MRGSIPQAAPIGNSFNIKVPGIISRPASQSFIFHLHFSRFSSLVPLKSLFFHLLTFTHPRFLSLPLSLLSGRADVGMSGTNGGYERIKKCI
jgi:hypothetical protein